MEGDASDALGPRQLILQVVEATGPAVEGGDDTEYHCSLEIAGLEGAVRLVTRGRRGPAPAWNEAFAIPVSALVPPPPGDGPQHHEPHAPRHGGAAAAQRPGLLQVRLATRKLLRTEGAALACGELPLDGLATCLAPGAPPLSQSVLLQAPAGAKAPRAGGRGGAAAPADAVLLRLAVVHGPGVPPGLKGAAGALLGRGGAAGLGCCASALSAAGGPSLHVPQGVLLEVPPLQHVRLVLHAATGLRQLHLEPAAALTAVASLAAADMMGGGGGGGAGGGGEGHEAGRGGGGGGLMALGNSWLQSSSRGSRLAGAVAAAWAAKQKAGQGAPGAARELSAMGAAAAPESPSSSPGRAAPGEQGGGAGAGAGSEADAAAGADAGAGGASPAAAAAADAAAAAGGSPPAAAGARPWLLPEDEAQRAALLQQQSLGRGGAKAKHRSVGSVEREVLMGLLEDNGFHHTDAPGGAFFYMRMSCAAATDGAPGAAASLTASAAPPPGAAVTTRMVPLCGANGCAVWEQVFWFALQRPADVDAKVEFELMASTDKKQRGRCVAKLEVPLHKLLDPAAMVQGGPAAWRFGGGGGGRGATAPGRWAGAVASDAAPLWEHELTGLFWERLPFALYVSLQAADADHRADAAGLPRALPPRRAAAAAAAAGASPPAAARAGAAAPLATPPRPGAGDGGGGAAGGGSGSAAAIASALATPVTPTGAGARARGGELRASGELQRAASDASGASAPGGGAAAPLGGSPPAGGSPLGRDPGFGAPSWAAASDADASPGAAGTPDGSSPRPPARGAAAAGEGGGGGGAGRGEAAALPASPSSVWSRSSSKGSLAAQQQQQQPSPPALSAAAAAAAVAPFLGRQPGHEGGAAPPGGGGGGGGGASRAAGGPMAALGAPFSSPEVVAAFEIVVKGFELPRPADCFFVLQLGPYWAISTTTHSTRHPAWHWHMLLPVWDPASIASLALFRRDDQSGGKKVVTMRSVFGDSLKMVGKLRVRLSTLAPNHPVNVTLPLQGERSNLRGGRERAAAADLFLLLRAPSTPAWLRGYAHVPVPRPLFLLASLGEPPLPPDALGNAERRAAARWLLDRVPHAQQAQLHARALARVMDDGRGEFTLSRARHNWRRLIAARAWAAGTLGAGFAHVCAWENVVHSGGVSVTVVLLGMYPSQVLALLLLTLAALLWRSPGRAGAPRPPPMEADAAAPDEGGDDGGSAVPADPYSALKQNYDALLGFTTTVQNVLDGWAASIEGAQALATWRDPTASAVLLAGLVGYALALWLLGLRTLVTIGLLWVFRPPALRDPCPPPPANFFGRLPNRSDTTL
ncbi:MAG: hypothetical protein J3K34DRAFT_527166 [Monoraphidium minutum]|nr:MAG: hypothetical protein J3K34DRAFT_527166 [Monoraphidium minutum]